MAETKKTEAAAAAAPPEAACLTLRQKLVEMRKACPEIVKKQHSDGVSYKYAKIYDVWEKITPIGSTRPSSAAAALASASVCASYRFVFFLPVLEFIPVTQKRP